MAPYVECGSRAYQVLTALVALRGLYDMGQNAKDMEGKIAKDMEGKQAVMMDQKQIFHYISTR